MGLDMYLTAERYLWEFKDTDKEKAAKVAELFPELDGKRVKNIEVEVGYWRKANAVHNWFVQKCQEGVDECQKTWISTDNLKELLDTVNKVLADKQLAQELLPSASGFFFGSTEYDEWYFQDLEDTREFCESALALRESGDWDIYYQSSW